MSGVILHGPPASGKDTVTEALVRLDKGYSLYRKLKVGPGRTTGYRQATYQEVDTLRDGGLIVYENTRYSATYVIDRPTLSNLLARAIPVIHIGQAQGIEALRQAFDAARLLVVSLWCPREIAAARIAKRNTGDDQERLRAWDSTEAIDADLRINTADISAACAAKSIDAALYAFRTEARRKYPSEAR